MSKVEIVNFQELTNVKKPWIHRQVDKLIYLWQQTEKETDEYIETLETRKEKENNLLVELGVDYSQLVALEEDKLNLLYRINQQNPTLVRTYLRKY